MKIDLDLIGLSLAGPLGSWDPILARVPFTQQPRCACQRTDFFDIILVTEYQIFSLMGRKT